MRTQHAALVAVAALSGCTTDAVIEEPTARCTVLEGKAFTSVDAQADCGLPAPGSPPASCHWSISIETSTADASRIQWQWSDVEESFDIHCHGSSIITSDGSHTGGYDAATGILTWQGAAYTPVAR